ncbi:hypothetical protein QFZ81_006023 [Paenibacillus sp. V4I9]|uniref:hypothetical protein n=1 Tax=Paenibacillus sp. V4I9 TaxID=3042308 RepID=UPI00278619B8|nr:hypothetical protein [Paenibacillus sp. V4I9]MDQ0890935.1 hypothetical protein [Paenibacillus sp. V4I9]
MLKMSKFSNLISIGFYFSLLIGALLKLYTPNVLGNFNRRIISASTLAAVDVNSRISFYYKYLILGMIVVVLFAILYRNVQPHLSNLIKKDKSYVFYIGFYNIISFFGMITLISNFVGSNSINVIYVIMSLHFCLILTFFWKWLANRESWVIVNYLFSNNKFVIWSFLFAFSLMLDIHYVLKNVKTFKADLIVYIMSYLITVVVSYVLYSIIRKREFNKNYILKIIIVSAFPIFIIPSILPISNELYLILNQRGILNVTPLIIQKISFIIAFCASIVIFGMGYRGKFIKWGSFNLKGLFSNIYYPFFLIMLVIMLYHPAVKMGPPSELFESGNPGIAIDQLFRYGKIPIIETFNAHAFSELFGPLVFSIINGYQGWASNLYSEIIDKILYYTIAFYFLKNVISKEFALLTLLLFPFQVLTNLLLPNYFIFALISIFAIFILIKSKSSFYSYLTFWFILSLTFIWRFDLGAAAIMSTLFVLIPYVVIYRDNLRIKKLVLSGIFVFVFWLLLFLFLATLKQVPVIFRLRELLSVISSNQVWGYPTLGDSRKLKYYLFYFLVPISNLMILLFVIYKVKFINKIKAEVFISIVFLILFSLFNFPRGLVRHSLVENKIDVILGFFVFYVSFIPFLIFNKRKLENYIFFSATAIGMSIIILFSSQGMKIVDNSLFSQTMKELPSLLTNVKVENSKIIRYEESPEYTTQTYSSLKKLFDETMSSNDTFLDFGNLPYLYVYTNRKTPMYINQTPAFLSDEISQTSFLKEINSLSIPYVIFADKLGWNSLDGIPNNIRSYRVAEFIYKNYEPFIKMNGMGVWVLQNRKNELEAKLNKLNNPSNIITLFDSKKDGHNKYKVYNLNAVIVNNTLKLVSGSLDPQIYGILAAPDQQKIVLGKGDSYLEMTYSSEKAGDAQVFYSVDNKPFSEQMSSTIHIDETKEQKTVKIPILTTNGILSDVRIDPPTDGVLYINSLYLKTRDLDKVIDQEYRIPLEDNVDISWLPYYWGSNDPLDAKTQTEVQGTLINNEKKIVKGVSNKFRVINSIQKDNGNYLHLNLKSDEIGDPYKMEIKYSGLTNMGESSTSISFFIKADGQYHDYLIRMSSQYNWYRTNVDMLNLTSEAATTLQFMSIREGD